MATVQVAPGNQTPMASVADHVTIGTGSAASIIWSWMMGGVGRGERAGERETERARGRSDRKTTGWRKEQKTKQKVEQK